MLMPIDPENASQTKLWIGTWSMGGESFGFSDERECLRVLEEAFQTGYRHIDTAGFYAHGNSERLVAKAIRGNRSKWFISSKGGLHWEDKRPVLDGSPQALRKTLFETLERLNTDYLDLYQLHWPDPNTPLSASIAALRDLQREGLIRNWGVCNLSVEQVKKEIPPGASAPHQVHFNLLHRETEKSLLAGKEFDRCLNLVYSPLEQGLFGSSPSAQGLSALSGRDHRRKNPHFLSPQTKEWLRELERLLSVRTQEDGQALSKIWVALVWLLKHRAVDVIICGPRTTKQFHELKTTYELAATLPKIAFSNDQLWDHLIRGPHMTQS